MRVLLPAPLWPTTPKISPSATSRVTSSSARTAVEPDPKVFVTLRREIMDTWPYCVGRAMGSHSSGRREDDPQVCQPIAETHNSPLHNVKSDPIRSPVAMCANAARVEHFATAERECHARSGQGGLRGSGGRAATAFRGWGGEAPAGDAGAERAGASLRHPRNAFAA